MSANLAGRFKDEHVRNVCMVCAGPYFNQMLDSYQTTIEYLKHLDPRARLGAVAMIRDYWNPPPDFTQLCVKMAREDPDVNVRCIALNTLIPIYYGTWDVQIGQWLARMVHDDTEPSLVRKLAYCMLYSLRAVYQRPLPPTLQFPEQVDWVFVDSFFVDRDPPSEAEKLAIEKPYLSERFRKALACLREAEQAIKNRDLEGAINHLTYSIKSEPSAGAFLLRGRVNLQLGNPTNAIPDFDQALEIAPSLATAYLGRAQAYEQMGLYVEARRDYDKAVELDPRLRIEGASGTVHRPGYT